MLKILNFISYGRHLFLKNSRLVYSLPTETVNLLSEKAQRQYFQTKYLIFYPSKFTCPKVLLISADKNHIFPVV